MLSTQKRSNPFEDEDEVRMDVCSSASKRGRWDEATPLRKRNFIQSNNQPEVAFTLRDLEKAREEARLQSLQMIRTLVASNESLKLALAEAVNEKEKLSQDCKVLKAGVLSLNNRNTQLQRDVEVLSSQLREQCERNQQLQSAIMHANWSMGGCRKDDHPGQGGSGFDGDVF